MSSTRRLQALFLLSSLGVLVVVGLLVDGSLGPVACAVYAVAVVVLLVLGARRARAAAAPAAGRTCSCCTTTVHDRVEVRP